MELNKLRKAKRDIIRRNFYFRVETVDVYDYFFPLYPITVVSLVCAVLNQL